MAEQKGTSTQARTQREGVPEHQRSSGGPLQRQPHGEEVLGVPGWASPFGLMRRMTQEMDRVFERMFDDFGFSRGSGLSRWPFAGSEAGAMWAPRVEVFQKDDKFVVRAELPGLKKEDVEVNVTEDAITIHGERQEEHERKKEGFYHSERSYGSFYRTVPLPEGVITDSAKASFRDGVLEVELQAPPNEVSRGRRLEISDTKA